MKRLFCLLCISLILGVRLITSASAEENSLYPILPYGHPEDLMPIEKESAEVTSADAEQLSVSISPQVGDYFTETTTWTFSFAGGDGNYSYTVQLVSLNVEFKIRSISYAKGTTTDQALDFSYKLLASGDYLLYIWLSDGSGQSVYKETVFSAYNDDYPTVSQRCSELVAECRAEGMSSDYEIALWMHEWLIYHANYDYDHRHYGPDGVLMGGTGVCDSYSKAYLLLLREAGIPVIHIRNSNHSWNAVQLDGGWYNVDVTWDDPGQGGGKERHIYCFIPDEVMNSDHKDHDSTVSCTSYEYNYFVRSGTADTLWGDNLARKIDNGLQTGDYTYSVDFPTYYIIERLYYPDRNKAGAVLGDLLGLHLARDRIYSYDGEEIALVLSPIAGTESYGTLGAGSVAVSVDTAGKTLYLPENLISVEGESFEGDSGFRAVTVPDGTEHIDSRAFSGCSGLWVVFIPESVTNIEADAFDSTNPHLTIVAPEGSIAEEYANENHMRFRPAV